MLLAEIREALPDTKILLLEPYVLDGSGTHRYIGTFAAEVAARSQAVQELAEAFGLPFLPLQKPLEQLTQFAPGDYWLADGVHPNSPFHQCIADRWIEVCMQELI